MVAGMMECDSGIVMEDVCKNGVRNLGLRLVLMLMRAGILVGELVVVVVGVMVVVVVGVISISEKRCLSVTEVECLGISFGMMGCDILKTYPCSWLYSQKLPWLDSHVLALST